MPKGAMPAEEVLADARSRREARFDTRMESQTPAANTENATPKIKSAPPVAAQMIAASQVAQQTVAKEKTDILSLTTESFEVLATSDARSVSSTPGAGLASILNRPDTPTMIARQMVESLQKAPDKPVEIALNPKELGRVRMSISSAEAGITVNVVAERPETLDLMRRNIEQLAREFVDLGYTNMEFAFAQGESSEGSSGSEGQSGTGEGDILALEIEQTPEQPDPNYAPASGLDLRL